MRCPKCGFISFDKVETCSKCAISLADVSASISGTVLNVEAPFFLASVFSEEKGEAVGNIPVADVGDDDELDLTDDVPSVDLSRFEEGQEETLDDEEQGVDFQFDEDDVAGEAEESSADGGGIDFQMDDEELGDIAMDDFELDVEPEEKPSGDDKAGEPEGGISLDLDVDLEDEPEDDMVFNLEDIDMSDLVIEDSGDLASSGDEAAVDLESLLADDGDTPAAELEDIPMDLSLEDGELMPEDTSSQDDDLDLPEIKI